jgi:hypothetical protein
VDAVDNTVDVPLPLDGLPQAPERKRVAPSNSLRKHKPTYRRLDRATHRCDDCMALHRSDPHAPLALPGRFERRLVGQGARYLCYEHVQHWREFDAMPPLEDDR